MTFGRSLSRNIAGALGVVVLSAAVFGGMAMIGRSDAPVTAAGESNAGERREVDPRKRDEADGESDTDALDDRGVDPSGDGDGDVDEPDDAGGPEKDEDESDTAGEDEEPDSAEQAAEDVDADADGDDPVEEPDSEESSAEDSASDESASDESQPEEVAPDEQEADESESTDADGDDHEHARIDPASIDLQVLDGYQSDGGAAAASVADQLRRAGYRVVAENPALRYDVTAVLWSQGGEAQARQVAAEIGAAEVRPQPGNLSESVAVHVVVGSDRG